MNDVLAVDDFAAVQIGQPFDELGDKVLGLILSQPLSLFQNIVESVVAAELEQDVDVVIVLEHMVEPNYSTMS